MYMAAKGPVTEKGKIAEMRPVKKEPKKTEREKLRELKGKEKAEYIWEYYKAYFVTAAIVLVIGLSLLNSLVLNPPKKVYLNFITYGDYVPTETVDAIATDLSAKIVPTPDTHEVYGEGYFISESDPETSMGVMQKLVANISIGEIDLIIADKPTFASMLSEEMIKPISGVFNQATLAGFDEAIIYRAAPVVYDIDMKATKLPEDAYGFLLKDNAYFESLGITIGDRVIGVVTNSQRPEAVIAGLKVILGEAAE